MVYADKLLAVFGRWLLGGWKSKSKELREQELTLERRLNGTEWVDSSGQFAHVSDIRRSKANSPRVGFKFYNFPDILSLYSDG